MENPRTSDARDHDDSALIDNAEQAPTFAQSSGGAMARAIGAEDETAQIDDPEARTRVRKDDAIAHGEEQRPDRARAPDNS